MIKLWYAPLTRSFRVLWLLEELGLAYELKAVEFKIPSGRFFSQETPTGKLPTIEDGDLVLCESGAIVEYLVERYGEGRLAPPPGTSERGRYLQWIHMAESTVFPPVGVLVSIAPGPFESKMMAATLEQFGEAIIASCPMGRIGEPEDMAGVAIYLSSRAGAYLTGVIIPVDGGISTTT